MAERNEFCTAYPVLARQSENTIGGIGAGTKKCFSVAHFDLRATTLSNRAFAVSPK
jgi:hypothetical protein